MRPIKPSRLVTLAMLAAMFAGRSFATPPIPVVTVSVNTLGNGTLNGPNGVYPLVGVAAADPGPGGLSSVLTYPLQNPPSLVFGDVQLTSGSSVTELIRFNPAGRGSSGYLASLLFYSSPSDGAGHLVNTPIPPTSLYPNVVSVPVGTVYTPTAGQPGYVAFVTTHYTFQEPPCTYNLSPSSVSISGAGGSGSFTIIPSNVGCPIGALSGSDFVTFALTGDIVNYSVLPNPSVQSRTGTITVGGQAPQFAPRSFRPGEVRPATIAPPALTFTITQAGATVIFQPSKIQFTSGPGIAPAPQTVYVSGATALSVTISSNEPWAKATSNSVGLPATLTITVNPAGLTAGDYAATITLNADGILIPFTVLYYVQGLPSLVTSPLELAFSYTGGAAPPSQQLSIYATSPVAFQAAGGGFVSVTPTSGTTTQSITVSVDPSKLTSGVYSGSVTITGPGVTNSPLVIPVSLTVTLTGPQITSVVNSASLLTGPIAPGSLFTIFGTSLSSVTLTAPGPSYPASLGGVSLTLNGVPAPLLYVSPTQINAQAPYEVPAGIQSLVMTVGEVSSTVPVTIQPAAPGIFQVNARGAILNQDYSLNTPDNPALVGSVVQVFFTGQGLVSPPVATGAPAPSTPLSLTNLTTTAMIGTQPAQVLFSGLAPGFAGLAQVDVLVPALTTKDYQLVLTVNGVQSNGGTVAVKAP